MSGKVTNVPLSVDIALCQQELKRDRREIRATRTIMEERRIRASDEIAESAFVMKGVATVAEMLAKPAEAAQPDERFEQVTKDVQGALEKCLQDGFEQLRKGSAALRGADMGEDVASKSSSEMSTQLSKLKRSQGSAG